MKTCLPSNYIGWHKKKKYFLPLETYPLSKQKRLHFQEKKTKFKPSYFIEKTPKQSPTPKPTNQPKQNHHQNK